MPTAPIAILPPVTAGDPPAAPSAVLGAVAGGSAPDAPSPVLATAAEAWPDGVIVGGNATINAGTYAGEAMAGTYLTTSQTLNGKETFTPDGLYPITNAGFERVLEYAPETGWNLIGYEDGLGITNWDEGSDTDTDSPVGATLNGHAGGTGTPTVSVNGVTAPEPVLGAVDGGEAPDAPDQVLAAVGEGDDPTAPNAVMGAVDGGGAPTAPAAVLAAYLPTTPTAPRPIIEPSSGWKGALTYLGDELTYGGETLAYDPT